MTLGQFAAAIPAPPKWVLNAHAILELDASYTVEDARTFALTRVLEQAFGIPLKRAYRLALTTLREPPKPAGWRYESPDGTTSIVIDRERFLSNFTASLSCALAGYAERRRGRPPQRRRRGLAAAEEYGVDLGLLRESLKRTPSDRLQSLDDDAAFVQSLKVQPS